MGLESEGPEGATVRQTMCDWLPGLFRKPWWLPWFLYQQSCPLDHEEVLSSLESLDAPFAFQFRSGQRGFFFLGPCGRWGQWWLGKHWFYFFFFAFSPSQESLGTRSGVGRLVGGAAVDFSLAGEEPPLFTCEFLPLEPSPSWPQ